MANTPAVGSTNKSASYEEYQKEQRIAKNQLGKNDFLNLLAAQMKYQDPLEPTKDSDFVAQLAQFSALEQMQTMSNAMTMMQAYDLVGKYVIAPNVRLDDGTVQTFEGVVNSIVYKDGEYFAQIGDAFVKVSKIAEVLDADYISPENKLTEAAHLLGCTVKGYMVDEKGDAIYDKSKPISNDKGEPVYDITKPIMDESGKPKLGADGKPLYEPLYEVKSAEGTVTGLGIKNGEVVAFVETADGSEAIIPIKLIFDIRGGVATTPAQVKPEEFIPPISTGNGTIITPENPNPNPPSTNPDDNDDSGNTTENVTTPDGGSGTIIIPPPVTDTDDNVDDNEDDDNPVDDETTSTDDNKTTTETPGGGGGIIITP